MAKQRRTMKINQFPNKINRNKKSKIISTIIFILIFALAVASGFFAIRFWLQDNDLGNMSSIEVLDLDTREITEEEKDDHIVPPDHPRFLSIPSIGINRVRILGMGVTHPNEQGAQQMETPVGIHDVAWFNCQINPIAENRCALAQKPGSGNTVQASVMNAHACFSTTYTCVFDRLAELRNGDEIIVELGDGTEITYIVRLVEIRELENVDMAKVMRPIEAGLEGLNLITCAGEFDGARDSQGVLTANQRVLVYTIRED